MISCLFFGLSAACVAAMFVPRKAARPTPEAYTYYVGDDAPMPTWKRKLAPMAGIGARRA